MVFLGVAAGHSGEEAGGFLAPPSEEKEEEEEVRMFRRGRGFDEGRTTAGKEMGSGGSENGTLILIAGSRVLLTGRWRCIDT